LQRDDRVIDVGHLYADAPRVVCNIIPKQMTRVELLENYRWLLEQARSWEAFRRRLLGFLNGITYRGKVAKPSLRRRLGMLGMLLKGMVRRNDNLPIEVRKHIRGAIRDTLKIAPYKLGHVIGLLAQQVMDDRLLPYHSSIIQKQLDDCHAGRLALDRDPSAGMIPHDFYKSMSKAMPLLYGRLSREIHYTPGVPATMVDVVKDFLIRWGSGFQDFEPHHFVYLNELCDRHVQRWNENTVETPVLAGAGDEPLTAERAQSVQFVKGLLVAVEQELRGSARSPRAAAAGASGLVVLN
jgi:hypothetical protein